MPRSRFKTNSKENTGKSQRQYKVGELIRKTLVEVFEKVELKLKHEQAPALKLE
jgi:hypothetical protein